jgi:hypothetical protein
LPLKSFSEISFPSSFCKVKAGALSWMFMEISFLSLFVGQPGFGDSGRTEFSKAVFSPRRFRKILYRSAGIIAILAAFLSAAPRSVAQEDAPQITPHVKRPSKKSDQSPRALGLLQLTSSGKATLVPIAIRLNGKFYDAAAYKASPVPMALEPGTVYEGERTGTSIGLFTVNGALHSQAQNAASPWIGTGMWLPAGTEAPNTPHKAEKVPLGIETIDEPPRLSKGGSAPKNPPPPGPVPPAAPSQSSPAATPPAQSPTASSTDKSTEGRDKDKDKDKEKQKDKDAKPGEQSSGSSPQGPADTSGPRLRRGKPTQPLPSEEDVPGYCKPNSASVAKSTTATSTPVAATPGVPAGQGPIQFVPAISDAEGPDPRSYAFEWNKGEEEERRKQMVDLAKEQLRAYLSNREKLTTRSAEPNATTARRKPALQAAEPVFDRTEMRTFNLWGNNQPVMILSAQAHVPPAGATRGASTPSTTEATEYTITLAARVDIYNNLHKLYFGVTDKYHLDVSPRLELIDAVDAEGDGRGELLFRETTDNGSGYVIYRATADTLWKMYDSLNQK